MTSLLFSIILLQEWWLTLIHIDFSTHTHTHTLTLWNPKLFSLRGSVNEIAPCFPQIYKNCVYNTSGETIWEFLTSHLFSPCHYGQAGKKRDETAAV